MLGIKNWPILTSWSIGYSLKCRLHTFEAPQNDTCKHFIARTQAGPQQEDLEIWRGYNQQASGDLFSCYDN